MKTKLPTPPPGAFSYEWPFHDITTPAGYEIHRRVEAFRERGYRKAEVVRTIHEEDCSTHKHRRCDCSNPTPIVWTGSKYYALAADGSSTEWKPPLPHPETALRSDHRAFSDSVLNGPDWIRLTFGQHCLTIIGRGKRARYFGGPIDRRLQDGVEAVEGRMRK